jgi:hypothetical protein
MPARVATRWKQTVTTDVTQADKNGQPGAPGAQHEAQQRPVLGLQIPQQAPPKADSMLLDLRETEAWFEALPMANIGETARQVYSTLVEFNRIEIPDLLRAKTVEKFRPPVEYIVNNLQRHYVDTGLPLSGKGWKTASLARELHKELAIAYKVIVERMINGDAANFDRRLLVIALHRALTYLGQVLLQNALVYAVWPEGIWREINSIYAYASQNNVHHVPVKPDDGRQGASTSIEDAFKALMLFASATPYRLRQSHARLLFAHLTEWARLTTIMGRDDGGTSLGRFNVDLWSDSAPIHNALRTPTPGRRVAILDVRELLKHLRAEFEQAPWEAHAQHASGRPVLTRPLLRLLIVAWSRPPDRRFVRTRLNFELNVVAGMHAIHANLRSEDGPAPFTTTRAAVFELQETQPPARGKRRIEWSAGSLESATLAPLDSDFMSDSLLSDSYLAGGRTHGSSSTLKDFAPIEPAEAEPSAESQRHAVKTINESAGGYCIRWQGEKIPRVKIGELIGVESPADRRKYGLGVIRWMKQSPDQQLDLGLEVISTRCEAGELREVTSGTGRKRAPAYRCLVINDTDPATNATASLVMSAMQLQTGIDLWLSLGGREQKVRLSRLVEFTSAFARYQFEFVDADNGPNGNGGPGDEFSDLWSNL